MAGRKDSLDDDFLLFQRRPLIEFAPDQHLCIDAGFLLDKAGRSFYWVLHENTAPNRRAHLLGYWATVVETYVRWLAGQTYRGRGTITDNPRFPDNNEACDLMLKEGTRLVLIEIKASILTTNAKYSFKPELLNDELLSKAIHGDDGRRKGIAQLRRTIQRFQAGDAINGITPGQITTIYPVIAFLDKGFVSPYLANLYREHFDRTTLRRRPTTTAPYAITISDLEDVLPHTHKHDLTDIIDNYYRNNRAPAGTTAFGRLSDAKIPLLKNSTRGKDIVRERWHQFHDELILNTFPQCGSADSD
jgi:hypothetical protein